MVRPKELIRPFPPTQPSVMINDRVWFVPMLADASTFQFPGWCSPDLFATPGNVHVEFCSGNGNWIADKALKHPEKNWLAVEKRFDRARKIWSKIRNFHIPNLVVAWAEARALSAHYFPPKSVSSIYINFPDPWPKKRHAKHRLISLSFFEETYRTLVPGGELIFVTDDEPYSNLFLSFAATLSSWKQTIECPGYSAPPPDYGDSFFSSLFHSQGTPIRYHRLISR